jgi:hypothetical protein
MGMLPITSQEKINGSKYVGNGYETMEENRREIGS